MRLSSIFRRCGTLLCLAGFHLATQSTVNAQASANPLVHSGREVFEREFRPDRDPATAGDGLGPLFNARSCAKCHNQGGIGGAGDNSVNVQILSIIPPNRKLDSDQQSRFRAQLNEIHPEFTNSGSIILHREGTSPEYAFWHDRILGLQMDKANRQMSKSLQKRRQESMDRQGSVVRLPEFRGMKFMLTHRNTTSLLGANLIDAIPDKAILEVAESQAKLDNGILGKVSRISVPGNSIRQIGKFGWRGQTDSLENFVRGACVAEMGLQLEGLAQPMDPTFRGIVTPVTTNDAEAKTGPVDISDADLATLVSFVRVLPPPVQKVPAERSEQNRALRGREHFNALNCAQCHTPSLGGVDGIFSDLLLHDMGQSLEDPLPTPGLTASIRISTGRTPGGGYYGAPAELFVERTNPEIFRSWRTPPLWGVRDTAPYMHDGRAATLHDAVLAHDGEGLASMQNYLSLPHRDQQALVAYLRDR